MALTLAEIYDCVAGIEQRSPEDQETHEAALRAVAAHALRLAAAEARDIHQIGWTASCEVTEEQAERYESSPLRDLLADDDLTSRWLEGLATRTANVTNAELDARLAAMTGALERLDR